MKQGTVKFFNETKGFGFIVEDETGKEVFVHISGITGQPIKQGEKVSFEISEDRRGPAAVNVKKI